MFPIIGFCDSSIFSTLLIEVHGMNICCDVDKVQKFSFGKKLEYNVVNHDTVEGFNSIVMGRF